MTKLERAILQVVAELRSLKRPWALVGGLAVSARTEPRHTKDADFAVATRDDADAEQVVHAFVSRGFVTQSVIEHVGRGRLGTVRLIKSRSRGPVVDLLFAASGIEPEVAAAATEEIVGRELTLPVARIGHLIAMKLLSESPRRPQDQHDLSKLLVAASASELTLARRGVRQISKRGFGRDKDLEAALDDAIERYRG